MATVQRRFYYDRSDSAIRRAITETGADPAPLVISYRPDDYPSKPWRVSIGVDGDTVYAADYFDTAEAWVGGFLAGEADTITLERDASGALTGYVRVE